MFENLWICQCQPALFFQEQTYFNLNFTEKEGSVETNTNVLLELEDLLSKKDLLSKGKEG